MNLQLMNELKAQPDSNRIVHGLWIGNSLSRMELLTLRSFVRFGHEFHLWVYDDLDAKVPMGVSLRDASQILPRERIFRTARTDVETGVGRNALPPFSDLFRYKLLYDHGGIWVDMDVTCLRRFDFADEYLFRPHRLGMVGNVMKCPKGSELMRSTFEDVDAVANEDVAWLTPNRILNQHVKRLGLDHFIRAHISNEDSWMGAIRPFIERFEPFPDSWYAFHWANEFFRTLKDDDGHYRGQRVLDYVPDKDNPFPGSTLHELYRYYRLIDPWTRSEKPPNATAKPRPVPPPGPPQMRARDQHVNILLPSLVRGGAERVVTETVTALRHRSGITQNLFVEKRSQQQYAIPVGDKLRLSYLSDMDSKDAIRRVALDVLSSGSPVLFTHLMRARVLQELWRQGVATVPVVHNARPGWLDPPTVYNDPHVPFVVACADAVGAQLFESGCERPIVTVRHELQRWFGADELADARREIRDRHGIADDTLVLGMIGQFKSQKAYTRAVRVLSALREIYKVKLMILGSWDHAYGSGRAAYEATMRLAVELGIVADVIVVGNVERVDLYLGAFDIFLNTSVYEGLSISLLEAIQAGCPIVTANAGGNREVLPPNAVLVEDSSDIDAYITGVTGLIERSERMLPAKPMEYDLVPRLWPLLAKHGITSSVSRPLPPSGSLFVTQFLHVGGPARSLVNLLAGGPSLGNVALAVLGGISVESFRDSLGDAQVPILSLDAVGGLVDQAERILAWFDALNLRNLVFWNLQPEMKLLLTKIFETRPARIIDVSPGPMLFDEMASAQEFQRRVSLSARGYFERLDCFVGLYQDGLAGSRLAAKAWRTEIIPLGVPRPPRFVPLPPAEALLPQCFDSNFAIGTCCRIVPDKRVEFLFDMMRELVRRVPKATLTIVGGPDSKSMDYWETLLRRVRDERLDYIRFVGRYEDVNPFLSQFRLFVMVSDRQGCPNASLEAMAMGLPVIANPDGGTAEQISDGLNGFLAETPEIMAEQTAMVLSDPVLRRTLGENARQVARTRFSMDAYREAYCRLLDASDDALAPRTILQTVATISEKS